MIHALELGNAVSVEIRDLAGAVGTGIPQRLVFTRGRMRHDEREVGDLVHDVVADVGNVLLAAGDLPDLLPDLLDLAPGIVLADPAIDLDALHFLFVGGFDREVRGIGHRLAGKLNRI